MKEDPGKSGEQPYPEINMLECKSCGRCVEACPKDLLAIGEKFNERGYRYVTYKGEGCTGCGACYYTCPEPGTIEVHGPPGKRKGEP